MKENPIKRIPGTMCPKCHHNTIVCYDDRQRRLNYPKLLELNSFDQIKEKLSTVTLSYMICENCRSRFIIDWGYGIPYPLKNEKLLEKFK